VSHFLIDAEFLAQRFHRQQVLTANGIVVNAGSNSGNSMAMLMG
jgi:hypothetical protein